MEGMLAEAAGDLTTLLSLPLAKLSGQQVGLGYIASGPAPNDSLPLESRHFLDALKKPPQTAPSSVQILIRQREKGSGSKLPTRNETL